MRVSKWGNSLAVRLPKKLVQDLNLTEGDEVDITAVDRRSLALVKRDDKAAFIDRLRALQKPTPAGFRWSRDEANER
jgi:antitoxin MazE